MDKKVKIRLTLMMTLVFIALCVFIQAQGSQKITLRYKFNVGDIREYECVTEKESDRTAPTKGKSLRSIKEKFKYEILEITPDDYFKVRLNTTPVESKGVNIRAEKRSEMHNFVAGHKYEEVILNTKGEISSMTVEGWRKEGAFIRRTDGTITNTLIGVITGTLVTVYKDMIRYLHPIMPEEAVGINDTWNYEIIMVPERVLGAMACVLRDNPSLINYKLVAFEKKDGFDCVKIEYNYKVDHTDKINEEFAKVEQTKNLRVESKIVGKGIAYFAYNEGFLISRKENLMNTYIGSKLTNNEWKVIDKKTIRIGFTMNYIKP